MFLRIARRSRPSTSVMSRPANITRPEAMGTFPRTARPVGGLARARLPHQPEGLTASDGEAHVVDRGEPGLVLTPESLPADIVFDREPLHLQQSVTHARPPFVGGSWPARPFRGFQQAYARPTPDGWSTGDADAQRVVA